MHKKLKTKKILAALGTIVCLTTLFVSAAAAAVPTRINFQGKLLDTNKNPRNGPFDMTFRICDSPSDSCASPIWWEPQTNVNVSNGVFSTQLGSVTPIPSSVFSNDARYLEIQIGSEVSTTREQLVTSPYAFKASVADDLVDGDSDYIQSRNTLQAGATFYVSSGTVAGNFAVGGVIRAGSGNTQITNAAGNLDATKLIGILPDASLSGSYSNSLNLSSNTNVFAGDGSALKNVVSANLLPGNTNYIQNRNTLQSGASFYVSSGAVSGSFSAGGTVSLGGAAGTSDVIVNSNLMVGGDVRLNGNDILDSAGTTRVTVGDPIVLNGSLTVSGNSANLQISTSVIFNGVANGDNYIAFPFVAGGNINNRDVVIISGANSITTTTTAQDPLAIGIAVNSASLGGTVYVATQGIITGVTVNGAVVVGANVCSTATAGRIDDACGSNSVAIGKALTGAAAAGQTIKVVLMTPR